jgi:N-sulfoglucosamine sulfohydrolase
MAPGAWIASALLILFLMAGSHSFLSAAPKLRPNILFLISDDHSGNDLSIEGKDRPRTPFLDTLASSGARFTNAFAVSSQCSPSRASIVTGRSPHSTGTSRLHSTLTSEHNTVIDAFRRAGYHVGAFRKVHLGESFQSRWQFYGGNEVPFETFFRDRPDDRPFFLWIGFDDPHRPYQPEAISPSHDPAGLRVPGFLPDNHKIRQDLAHYYDEITRMDRDAGQVLSLLDANELSKNTLVVFAGDNGMPFPGAKGSLYHDGVNVPLIVRWPDIVAPGQVLHDVVSLVDLTPTLLEAASVASMPRLEGKSLLPLLTGRSAMPGRAAFFERNWHDNLDLIRGVRTGNYLLIQNYRPELAYPPTLDLAESPSWIAIKELHNKGRLPSGLEKRYFAVPRPSVELYDIASDPFQLENLAGKSDHSTIVRKLQILLSDWMTSTNDFLPPPIPPKRGAHGESIHP